MISSDNQKQAIGLRIKEARSALGLTQKELCEKAGMKLPSLRDYELGNRIPGGEAVADLARVGINANWLLTGKGEMLWIGILEQSRDKQAIALIEEGWWSIIKEAIKTITDASYWFLTTLNDPNDPLNHFVDDYNSGKMLTDPVLRKRIPEISLEEIKEWGRTVGAWKARLIASPASEKDSIFSGFVLVPRYDVAASMGNGAVIHSEQIVDHLAFRAEWVRTELGANPNNLVLISAIGDSMEPTLRAGDLLLIDRSDAGVKQDAIYAFATNGELRVKRMQLKIDGRVVVKSDNPQYDSEILTSEMAASLRIVGRVVWSGRRM